jgi:hypothetical protein
MPGSDLLHEFVGEIEPDSRPKRRQGPQGGALPPTFEKPREERASMTESVAECRNVSNIPSGRWRGGPDARPEC